MEEWKEYRISDICTGIYEGPHATPKESRTGAIYLGIPAISEDGHINFKSAKRIAEEDLPLWTKRVTPQKDDIVFTNEATLNLYAMIPEGFHGCLGRRLGLVRPNKDIVNAKYLFYYFFSPEWRNTISQNKVYGATVERILMTKFPFFPVKLPNKSIQNKIVDILSSFDDKIEVNRRLNDNLLNQSNALFKSFFIDFEPFRECEFAETELGLIPKNWKILSFGDFIFALTEKAPVDSLPEYSVTNNGIIPRDTKFNKKLSKSSSMNKVLRKNNLVFGMSREILNWGIMEDEIGGVSSAYNIYKIDEDLVDPTYLRLYMKAKIAEFNSLIGTAAREGQSLDKGQLMQKKIYVPTKNVLHDFFARYCPYMETIHNTEQESRRLSQLRDALLPRLMSGELKVNDLETIK